MDKEQTFTLTEFILDEWIEGPTADIAFVSEEINDGFCHALMSYGLAKEAGNKVTAPVIADIAMNLLWPKIREKALKSELYQEWLERREADDKDN